MTINLAPSSLPRQQRRHIDRQLHKLLRRDVCSICGGKFKHNSRTFSGLDAHGNIAVAGECCTDQIAELFGMGFFSHRDYDFLSSHNTKPDIKLSGEQIVDAIVAYQEIIADTDKRLDGVERRGGVVRLGKVSMLGSPWKDDDRAWFEQNRERSHRVRMPFAGECDKEVAKTPAGHTLIVLLRQVEPGARLKVGFFLNDNLLPVPDDEAVAHALFEVATRHEPVPPNGETLGALILKYSTVCA